MGIESDSRNLEFRAKLAAKKLKVMQSVTRCLKTGKNSQQGYTYAEAREVYEVVRAALIEAGLVTSVSAGECHELIKVGKNNTPVLLVDMWIDLTDTETGYHEVASWQAAAMDSGDKAIYKALTTGLKYWLLHTFLIPTDDDVERDAPAHTDEIPQPTEAEYKVLAAIYAKVCEMVGQQLDAETFGRAVYCFARKYPGAKADIEKTAAWLVRKGIVKACTASAA